MKKILGIGNALVDLFTHVNDEFLQNLNYPKGSMNLVEKKQVDQIVGNLQNREMVPGGSSSNTICTLSELGAQTAFIGKISDDEFGTFYHDDLIKRNVTPHLVKGKLPTGVCCSMVTPDSERTMATYLGAATELKPEELEESFFKDISIVHIEGYLIHNYELITKSIELAKKQGALVSLDLASFNMVEDHFDFLQKTVKDSVDILFANEEEAFSFTKETPEQSIYSLSKICKIAIVKLGKDGVLGSFDEEIFRAEVTPLKAVDTTGAGDNFAAGFLYAYNHNYKPIQCLKIGNLLGGMAVTQIGAKIPTQKWSEIKKTMEHILS